MAAVTFPFKEEQTPPVGVASVIVTIAIQVKMDKLSVSYPMVTLLSNAYRLCHRLCMFIIQAMNLV